MRYLLLCRSPAELDVIYRTGWLPYHKIMKAIEMREAAYVLAGNVQLNESYLELAEKPKTVAVQLVSVIRRQ